ncbi:MAG: C1 family peptidase [Candidatus Cloacimonetes bacterium]|nr:C1 family peptidase [Candidatus Cloacimonadota bacterium]
MKKMIKPDSPVEEFFEQIGEKRAKLYSSILERYRIKNVEQFISVLSPNLPSYKDKELKQKCLAPNYLQIKKSSASPAKKLKKLRKLFKISTSRAESILRGLDSVRLPVRAYKNSRTFLSLGIIPSSKRPYCRFWSGHSRTLRINERHYIIPEYEKMGLVFDQGSRGTCVANAATGLIDYLTGSGTSRQFLYHQCKMIDGIPQTEGTYMEMPIEIICNAKLIDYGTVSESEWVYNPHNNSDVPQGPPPEICFKGKRYYSIEPVETRQNSVVEDVKLLLSGIDGYNPVPVTMGFSLYESFMSSYSIRTGEVSLPLPDEGKVGGHAMLIVGWDDDDGVFIVRNSWGEAYASENKYKMPGHALIPYSYFQQYTHGGHTVLSMRQQAVNIAEEDRLYKREYQFSGRNGKIAAISRKKVRKFRNNTKPGKRKKVAIYSIPIVLIVVVILLRMFLPEYYFEYRYYVFEAYLRVSDFISEMLNL